MPEQQHRELVGPNGFRADPLPLLDEDELEADEPDEFEAMMTLLGATRLEPGEEITPEKTAQALADARNPDPVKLAAAERVLSRNPHWILVRVTFRPATHCSWSLPRRTRVRRRTRTFRTCRTSRGSPSRSTDAGDGKPSDLALAPRRSS